MFLGCWLMVGVELGGGENRLEVVRERDKCSQYVRQMICWLPWFDNVCLLILSFELDSELGGALWISVAVAVEVEVRIGVVKESEFKSQEEAERAKSGGKKKELEAFGLFGPGGCSVQRARSRLCPSGARVFFLLGPHSPIHQLEIQT